MSSFAEKHKEIKERVARETIYEATLKVLSGHKVDKLKMQDIAGAAGVAIGTVYNYFENKEMLLNYVDSQLHDTVLGYMQEAVEMDGTAVIRLRALVEKCYCFCEKYHVVFNLAEQYRTDLNTVNKEMAQRLERAVGSIGRILEDGVKEGVFRPVDIPLTARYFLFTLIGLLEIYDRVRIYTYSQFIDEATGFLVSYLSK